jgi:hypothetical protein
VNGESILCEVRSQQILGLEEVTNSIEIQPYGEGHQPNNQERN